MVYNKKNLPRPVVFRTTGDIPIEHIKTNCRTLGITIEKFFEILNSI